MRKVTTHRYGRLPDQVGDLHLPERTPPWPVVVVIHGGFWHRRYDRSIMAPLAADLAARGYVAWNLEYRRLGQEGGGWPGTFEDVARGIDALRDLGQPLDLSRVVTLGHSAGGHLALWAGARQGLPAEAPGARPGVRPCAAVSLAGMPDLVRAAAERTGDGAVTYLLGGEPSGQPERYAWASPSARLPLSLRQLLVHGTLDDIVPHAHSRDYAIVAAAAGDRCEYVEVDNVDHWSVIDPSHASWRAVVGRLNGLMG